VSDAAAGADGPSGSQSAAEALRLFEAVQEWARRTSLGDLGDRVSAAAEGGFATGSEECTLCPICQVVHLVRANHPEVAEHLTDAVTALAAALRSAIGAHEARWTARPPGGVEHIDIG
jgi:Family of unknown function (DUF5304)